MSGRGSQKSAISYYGGKQRLASKLVKLIPRHTVYCEPFCGGAAVFFKKPWPNVTNTHHYREILNDIDGRLVNFYRQLRDNGKEIFEKILLTPYSEEEYRISKDLDTGDDLEKARRYFVNISQSFSNTLNGGWGRGVFGRNLGYSLESKKINLLEILDRLSCVTLSCDDAIKVIKQFDSPQTFFYLDPPYPETNQGHYEGYSTDDFKTLVSTLADCQASFLLSCYELQDVEIPKDWEKIQFNAHCTSSGKGKVGADRSKKATNLGNRKRVETVYRRFNKVPVRSEIQKLYDLGKFDCFVRKPETETSTIEW